MLDHYGNDPHYLSQWASWNRSKVSISDNDAVAVQFCIHNYCEWQDCALTCLTERGENARADVVKRHSDNGERHLLVCYIIQKLINQFFWRQQKRALQDDQTLWAIYIPDTSTVVKKQMPSHCLFFPYSPFYGKRTELVFQAWK